MNNNNKVSVIIPTYNRSELIGYAIDSVLNQSYKNIEIIIVDDGSTDDTESCVLSKSSDKIIYLKQNNQGVNAARNAGIKRATGEYIALLDNDDMWLDFKLDLQLNIMNQFPDVGFVYTNFYILHTDGSQESNGLQTWYDRPIKWQEVFERNMTVGDLNISFSATNDSKNIRIYYGDIYFISLFKPVVLPSTSLIRKEFMTSNFKFPEDDSICGDWEYFARLSRKHSCIYIDFETTLNRSHDDKVRLTRIKHYIQAEKHLIMINRTYKADNEFYSRHKSDVSSTEYQIMNRIVGFLMQDKMNKEARNYLTKLNILPTTSVFQKINIFYLIIVTRIPCGRYLLKINTLIGVLLGKSQGKF